MIPILFEKNATVFTANGIGRLTDAKSCVVTEERNGLYELEMTYPITGIRYEELAEERIILAEPFQNGEYQPFRIYRISRPLRGMVTVNAEHISYLLNKIVVMPFTASSCADAMSKIRQYAANNCPFTFGTDKDVNGTMTVSIPKAVRPFLGGESGSILDVYGTGEYEFDRFGVFLHTHRGQDNGVTLRYGKNITDLLRETDLSNVYTGIVPYWAGSDGEVVTLTEGVVYSSHRSAFAYDIIKPVDFSGEWESAPSESQLRTRAQNYVTNNEGWEIADNITVSFVQLSQSPEYANLAVLEQVHLCDTVSVVYEALGVETSSKVIRTEYNVLQGKYIEIELGTARNTLAQTVTEGISTEIAQASQQSAALLDYQLKLLKGALGGNVIVNTDADGKPYEILIINGSTLETSNKILRMNYAGIGFGTSYNDITTLWTIDGSFTASFIETWILSANQLLAGTIRDKSTNSNYWDLETGDFQLQPSVRVGNSTIASVADTEAAQQKAQDYADDAVSTLRKVVNKKVTTYYQAAQPAIADSVTGDLWIDTDDGNSLHRFNGTAWVDVDNANIQQALSDAADAQSTADAKIVTYAQPGQPTGATVGDLWIDTDDKNKLYRWNGTAWVDYRDGTITDAEQAAKNYAKRLVDDLAAVVDGKVTTYYQAASPAASDSVVGDLWIDTDDGNSLHRFDGTNWVAVDNADIAKALQDAADAQSTADSKIVTFAQTTQPATSVSSVGDLWIDTDDNNKLYRFNGTNWVAYRDGQISLSEQAAKDFAQGLVNDLTEVVDGKITTYYQGGQPSNPNAGDLWINTTGNRNTLYRYDGTSWTQVDNAGIAEAITAAQNAYNLADGKIVTYAQPTQPTSAQLGDMWIDTTNNANTLYRYDGTQWVAYHDAEIAAAEASAKRYTDTALNNYDQNVLDQQAVFNKLTNNGDITGIYMENGQLYVNATYIKSGTLTLGGANNQNGTMIVYDASGNEIGHWTNAGIYVKNGEIYQEQFVDESVGTAWLRIQSTEITGGYTALNHTALIDLQDWQWVTDTSTGEQVKEGVLNLKCQNGSVAITPDDGFYAQAPKEISIASGTGASMSYMDLSTGTLYNAVAVAAQGVAIVGNSTPIILSSSSGIQLNGSIRTNGYTGMTNTRVGWRHDANGALQYCSIVNGLLTNVGFY